MSSLDDVPRLPSGLRPIVEGVKKLQDLVLRAETAGKKGNAKDNKFYCTADDIAVLLGFTDKSRVIQLNGLHVSNKHPYIHRVSYEGIEFVTTTEKRVDEFDSYKQK